MKNYYTKYLKYKNKYLELKGGNLSEIIKLKQSKTTLKEIILRGFKNITELMEAGFTKNDFFELGLNYGNSSNFFQSQGITVKNFMDVGFTLKEMLFCGILLQDLKEHGMSIKQLKEGFTDPPIENWQLSNMGYTAKEFKDADISLLGLGFNLNELKDAGINNVDLRNLYKIFDCTIKKLKEAGFTIDKLKEAGFTAKELYLADTSPQILKDVGFTVQELVELKLPLKMYTDLGYSPQILKDAGYTAGEFKEGKVSIQELVKLGFTIKELSKDWYHFTPASFKMAEFSLKELKYAGLSLKELVEARFNPEELVKEGFEPSIIEVFSLIQQHHDQGLSVMQLIYEKIFTKERLNTMGVFSLKKLIDAGFNPREFVEGVKDIGFSLKELKDTGLSLKQLVDAGFSNEELVKEGFEPNIIKVLSFIRDKTGRSGLFGNLKQLIDKKMITKEILNDMGLSFQKLIDAGFSPEEFVKAGVTDFE